MSKRTKNRKGKVGRGKHNAQWMRENWAREIRLAKAKRGEFTPTSVSMR